MFFEYPYLLWLDANLRRWRGGLNSTPLYGLRLQLFPWLFLDPDGFRLFLADGILPCGIFGLAFLVLSFDGKRSTFRHFLSILDSWCLPSCPDLLFFRFDGI